MGLLGPLTALFGLELKSVAARARAAAILYGLMALFLLAAAIFLVLAAYLALADLFSPIIAALILSGAFLLLTLAIYAGTLIGRGRHRQEVAEQRRASESGAFVTTAALTALPMLLRSPAIIRFGLPAAAVVAFALLRDRSDKS
ncbi:hypothetical protein O9Z70_10670 [Devosia sp. YIM 151766]|uniref:hypothetical protein n=1 Tax=Devosia sp. YIM 151766 TaxID=3017325 RepID=UPI00255CB81F|nr:hypothetical protein [Devosia sp. YIM 151766]WIY51943.1 hypothetical protein O9Z70_10670 [Devosia sp. YIM 151766]